MVGRRHTEPRRRPNRVCQLDAGPGFRIRNAKSRYAVASLLRNATLRTAEARFRCEAHSRYTTQIPDTQRSYATRTLDATQTQYTQRNASFDQIRGYSTLTDTLPKLITRYSHQHVRQTDTQRLRKWTQRKLTRTQRAGRLRCEAEGPTRPGPCHTDRYSSHHHDDRCHEHHSRDELGEYPGPLTKAVRSALGKVTQRKPVARYCWHLKVPGPGESPHAPLFASDTGTGSAGLWPYR